jgi:uncharacterized protein YjbI with pentapeptide repeats
VCEVADRSQLEIIEHGVEFWNTWRAGNPGIAIDLTYADLVGRDLSKGDFSHANFVGATLRKVKFSQIDATMADFCDADLTDAVCSYSDFSAANFTDAKLAGTDFLDTDLCSALFVHSRVGSARFERASLGGTIFAFTDLSAAIGLEFCEHVGPSGVDFCTLENSGSLPEVFLRGCGLPDRLIDFLTSCGPNSREPEL